MDFVSGESQKKCLNNNSNTFCNKNHYLKNLDGEIFICNAYDFFKICRPHRAFVQARCDIVCLRDVQCQLHFRLERLEYFKDYVFRKNLKENKIVKKNSFYFQ